MSTPVKINVHFTSGKKNQQVLRTGKKPAHLKTTLLPRLTRLMALAVKYEHLLSEGRVKNHDELAELAGVDRSQVSGILRLRLLAPEIQEWLLNLPETENGKNPVNFIDLRRIASTPSWEKQRRQLFSLLARNNTDLSFPA